MESPTANNRKHFANFDDLPDSALLSLYELCSVRKTNRVGLLSMSASTVRRLESEGRFPQHIKLPGRKKRYYVAKDIREWLKEVGSLNEDGETVIIPPPKPKQPSKPRKRWLD